MKYTLFFYLIFYSNIIFAQENLVSERIATLLYQEEYTKAIYESNNALKTYPNSLDIKYSLALAYQGKNDHLNALNVLKILDTNNKHRSKIFFAMAKSYYLLGLIDKAKTQYENIIKADSNNVKAIYNLATLFGEMKSYREAALLFEKLANIESTNPIYTRNAAIYFSKIADYTKSIMFYSTTLKLQPDDPYSANSLATIFFNFGNPDTALSILDKAISFNPHNSMLYRQRGELFYQTQRYSESNKNFIRALELNDTSYGVFQKIGLNHYFMGILDAEDKGFEYRFLSAQNALETSLSKNKEDATTCMYLGLVNQELKNTEKAIEYINKSIKIVQPSILSNLYAILGTLYQKSNDYSSAIQNFNLALELDRNKNIIRYYIAYNYRMAKDKKNALKYYKEFINYSTEKTDKKLINLANKFIKFAKKI